MFSKELEALIQATLADGVLTDNEKIALVKRAEREGVDLAELEIYIDSLLQKRIQTERISREEKALARDKERKGNVCPHCGTPIPPLTKTCPNCGAAVGSNETVGDKELTKLVDQMEAAIVNLKSASAESEYVHAKASVESLLRKAKTFYGDNKKVQILVFELEEELKSAMAKHHNDEKKTIGKRVFYAFMWAALICASIFLGGCIPFFFEGVRNTIGNLFHRFIGE